MSVYFYLSLILGFTFSAQATIPKNGVVLTANSLQDVLNEQNHDSLYSQCVNQSRGARYFSNNCTHLVDALRKKMNVMVLESDLQIQAEKLSLKPVVSNTKSRIAMLAKINLLALQAEEAIKAAQNNTKSNDSKDDLPDILPAVKKVQVSYQSYARLLPDPVKYARARK